MFYKTKRVVKHDHASYYKGIDTIDEFLPRAASGFPKGRNIRQLREAAVRVGFAAGTVSSSRTRCVRAGTLIKIGEIYKHPMHAQETSKRIKEMQLFPWSDFRNLPGESNT